MSGVEPNLGLTLFRDREAAAQKLDAAVLDLGQYKRTHAPYSGTSLTSTDGFLPAGLKWRGAGVLQDKRYPKSFGSVPTAIGTITRLACTRLQEAGLSPKPLLAQAGLTVEQIKDRRD